MDIELLRSIAPALRGATLLHDGKGRPRGVPAFVAALDGLVAARGEGFLEVELPSGEAKECADAFRAALSAWRTRVGRPESLPSLVEARAPSGSLRFALGRDCEDAAAKAGRGDCGAWTPDFPEAVPSLSAARRSEVVKGRIALVTGGARGVGSEIVRGLCLSGATVFVADLNLAGARAACDSLNAELGRHAALPLEVDVADEASVQAAFDSIIGTSGGLDLAVSNAGVLKAGSVLEQSYREFRFVTEVNYLAFFLVAQRAARIMRDQAAAAPGWFTDIVQVNSKSGLQGSNKNGAYAGSKFGGIGLVQSFALELAGQGTKVNALCPGNFYDGPLWSDPDQGLFAQYLRAGKVPGAKSVAELRAFYEAKAPLRRGCEGPDLLRALYYLVEQEYETGQALPVAGGQVMLS